MFFLDFVINPSGSPVACDGKPVFSAGLTANHVRITPQIIFAIHNPGRQKVFALMSLVMSGTGLRSSTFAGVSVKASSSPQSLIIKFLVELS